MTLWVQVRPSAGLAVMFREGATPLAAWESFCTKHVYCSDFVDVGYGMSSHMARGPSLPWTVPEPDPPLAAPLMVVRSGVIPALTACRVR